MPSSSSSSSSSTVSYKELHEGSGETSFDFTPDSVSAATRKIIYCAWSDRVNLINQFYFKPHPDFGGLYALLFSVKPWGVSTGENTWEGAQVTIGYKSLPYNPTDYKEIAVSTSAENVSIPAEGTEYETGGDAAAKRVAADPQVFVAFTQISVTLHNQASVNESTWDGVINKVNSATFAVSSSSGFKTWGAGMLLYQGYDFVQKTMSNGTVSYEVTHKFLGSQFDHRQEFNPQTGARDKVKLKTSGNYKYDSTAFSVLGI